MKELYTHIEIGAPAERVWHILTDFAAYPEWNPFIPRIGGALKGGAQLDVRVESSGSEAVTLHPTVLEFKLNRGLRLLIQFGWPGLFDLEHSFAIAPLCAHRVDFIQRQAYSGLLVPLVSRDVDREVRCGLEAMNFALKERAEQELGSLRSGDRPVSGTIRVHSRCSRRGLSRLPACPGGAGDAARPASLPKARPLRRIAHLLRGSPSDVAAVRRAG